MTQEKSSKIENYIGDKIKELFDFHEYEIKPKTLLKISEIFVSIDKNINEKKINEFFKEVNSGKYGIVYKMPTCLLSMYWRYLEEKQSNCIDPNTQRLL